MASAFQAFRRGLIRDGAITGVLVGAFLVGFMPGRGMVQHDQGAPKLTECEAYSRDEDHRCKVKEGESFNVESYTVLPGWRIVKDKTSMRIVDLRVRNRTDGSARGIFMSMHLYRGDDSLAELSLCSAPETVAGQTVAVDCGSSMDLSNYDYVSIG